LPNLPNLPVPNFGNIAGQIAGNLDNFFGNLPNPADFLGNLPNPADFFGNLPGPGDFCFVPIICDFVKIVETEKSGSVEEKAAAVKDFVADWEKATPEAKQLFAPVAA
jgi:hypothetical protein